MLIEGRGLVAPAEAPVSLTLSEVEYCRRVAEERNGFRRYSSRSDRWGKGLVDDPVLVGTLAELATAKLLNRRAGCSMSVDARLHSKGDDGCDLRASGIGIQVKSRVKGSRNLIRRVDDRKRLRPLTAEVFVFCRYVHAQETRLLGWLYSDAVRRVSKHERSVVGDWWNLDVDAIHLRPVHELVNEIVIARSA